MHPADARPARIRPPAPGEPGGDAPRQSLLYWRKSLFDPDRLFNRLEPRLRFLWTRTFLGLSAAAILAAAWLVWAERQALVTQFPHALQLGDAGAGLADAGGGDDPATSSPTG